jgi:hypothetical protein
MYVPRDTEDVMRQGESNYEWPSFSYVFFLII